MSFWYLNETILPNSTKFKLINEQYFAHNVTLSSYFGVVSCGAYASSLDSGNILYYYYCDFNHKIISKFTISRAIKLNHLEILKYYIGHKKYKIEETDIDVINYLFEKKEFEFLNAIFEKTILFPKIKAKTLKSIENLLSRRITKIKTYKDITVITN